MPSQSQLFPLNLADAANLVDQFASDYNSERPAPPVPITTVRPLDIFDRRGRGYEVVIQQDPATAAILAYRVRHQRTRKS